MNQQFQIRIKDAKAQLQAHTGPAHHEPAAGQVLLQVSAASLNYRDLLTLQGAASGAARDGLVPLSDAVGTVLAVGDGVQGWQVGDRASPNFFPAWVDGRFDPAHLQQALGGGNTDGVLSQQLLVSAQSLVAPAAHLSDEEAATLPCAGLTAWHALFERGQVKAGETVLVQGTGGVALFGLQLAAAVGCTGDRHLFLACQAGTCPSPGRLGHHPLRRNARLGPAGSELDRGAGRGPHPRAWRPGHL